MPQTNRQTHSHGGHTYKDHFTSMIKNGFFSNNSSMDFISWSLYLQSDIKHRAVR